MATDKKTIIRLKILDELLTTGVYTKKELLDACNSKLREVEGLEISERTLSKDLSLIQNEFNVIVEEKKEGRKRLWYIKPEHSMYALKLSDEEKTLFRELFHTLGKFSGVPSFECMDNLSKSLGIASADSYKIIHFSYAPTDSDLLGRLFHFIANKRVVELYYRTFSSPEKRHIRFYPYLLKQYNSRWFVIGVAEDNFMLNFPLNNIYQVEDAGFTYPSYPLSMERKFDSVVGVTIITGKEPEDIICWVDERGFPYLSSKPFHSSMEEIIDEKTLSYLHEKIPRYRGGHFVKFRLIINTELKQTQSSYMGEIIVLEPSSLRDEMKEIARKITLRYCDTEEL